MAKQKNESNGVVAVQDGPQLMLAIDLDDIESIPVSAQPTEPEPVQAAPVPDSDESVIATVETFDQAFANDPLASEWLAFGREVKNDVDPADKAVRYVHHGRTICDLAVKERNLAPGSYDRAKLIKKAETALRVCNVPESMVRPNELIGMFWLVHLDRSTPGAEGEARSYDHSAIPAEWFGGNISVGVLRTLATCIKRVSKIGELDVYEYNAGFEASVRAWTEKLRNGDLTNNQVQALIAARKKFLAAEKAHAERAGLSQAEVDALDNAKRTETREKRLSEIRSDALTFQKNAAEKLKMGKEDLRDLLANMQIIPPERFITPQEYAAQMTPGDAKALVQELIKLYPTKPDRIQVFKVLLHTCKSIADQIKSAREKETIRKTA